LKITLVWTDHPGNEQSRIALENNLDLRVTAPDGLTVYKGNVFSGGESYSGGSYDTRNNTENVFIDAPQEGEYTVEVIPTNINTGPQPYSLVVTYRYADVTLWEMRYNNDLVDDEDWAVDIAVAPDSSKVYVTGTSLGATHDEITTVAYNADTSEELWVTRRDGQPWPSGASSIVATPIENIVYVTGWASDLDKPSQYVTIAYDTNNGDVLWESVYASPDPPLTGPNDEAYSIALSPDGNTVYITGKSQDDDTYFDIATVAYNATSGDEEWAARYEHPGEDYGNKVVVAPDGSAVYVTGTRSRPWPDWSEFFTIAYHTKGAGQGTEKWSDAYDYSERGEAVDMAVASDGSIYIIGTGSLPWPYAPDIVTMAYDPGGTRLWEDFRFGPMSLAQAAGIGIAVAPDGSMVYATGVGDRGFGISIYFTIAFDTITGDSVWVKNYPTDMIIIYGTNIPSDIAVAPDGSKVYITGWSSNWGANGDYATIAYKSDNGKELWVERYDSPGNGYDSAAAMAVAPNGKVFVTGTSVYLNQEDYLTIAYSG
jgi:hypothetical protein